ncbi:MORN repeat-containing protein 3 [Paramisgurnus dabryanus]|uniref:MORN repeat-containing protein 3 n=1 Tax=Paramisgurnus dabryanus TaxID=90735 RepID=UPI0031F4625C
MPFLKKPRTTEPPVKQWDKKAQKCGLLHTVYSANGDRYRGEWLDNKKHGNGMQVWKKTGIIYDGEWSFGKRHGYGVLTKFHREQKEYVRVYAGGWQNDKKEGVGTYFYSPLAFYEGHWSKDQRAGWGRMQYENGEVYEGEWLKDKHDGQGVLLLANGNRYEGAWRDGKKNGHGKFFYLDRGQLYEGLWVDGVAKSGTLSDFGRETALNPTMYPIPKVCLIDAQSVLMEAQSNLTEDEGKSTTGTFP